ncbi:MAG TPA: DUF3826 domain-containing protein [Verrucomicrobiae bacterium]|nr:DUF3826 domain-containing protein [Verrucomicrobiae bacterium]
MTNTFPSRSLEQPRGCRLLAVYIAAIFTAFAVISLSAADTTNATSNTAAPTKRLTKTVGLDIIKKTANPDHTTSLVFQWKEKGATMERTVVVNDKTIVVYNGQLKKFNDLTDEQMRAKAVATVGADDVTTVLLRFGKAPLPKDQLTPEQSAMIASLAPPPTAASDAALEKRVSTLVAALSLEDSAKQERVHKVLSTDLRAVRDAHNAGLQLDPSVHKNFIDGLQADLSPEQVESVKNSLTANKLPITLKAYHQILPDLKSADEAKIADWLKRAREESLDVKNVDEMSPIFKKYKTEIERYLDAHGYDWAKSYKAFVDGQKAGTKDTATDKPPGK